MKPFGVILILAALAACGIDGAPSQPENAIPDGSEARIGVVGAL